LHKIVGVMPGHGAPGCLQDDAACHGFLRGSRDNQPFTMPMNPAVVSRK
jgi:hypothetical protein